MTLLLSEAFVDILKLYLKNTSFVQDIEDVQYKDEPNETSSFDKLK